MTFPSIPTKINNNILDYHKFDVVKPISTMNINIHQPIVKSIKTTQPITRTLLHQRLAHCNSRKLDTMCRLNTLHGLPPNLSRNDNRECPICLMSKFSHPPKGKTINTEALHPGELLHIDFGFWDIPSHRGFTSMLLIIDAKTRMLWLFCSSTKRAPLSTLRYFFSILQREKRPAKTIRVDEDGALARNYEFTQLLIDDRLTLETTGGYASFLNGKVERPHRTIADMTRALYFNTGHSPDKWCYAAETAADVYRFTLHSATNMSPYEAWYGVKPNINHLRVWGCTVYVRVPSPTKSESRVQQGYFMEFTKSRLLIRWFDPSTNMVKHSTAARFDEVNTTLPNTNDLSPGSLLLSNTPPPTIKQPEVIIDISTNPTLESIPFTIHLHLPPIGTTIGLYLNTCTWNHLPYIAQTTPGTLLAQQLRPYGPHNATYWILSIDDTEFSTAQGIITFLNTKKSPTITTILSCILARRKPHSRTTFEDNRAIFNQIRFIPKSQDTPLIVLPMVKTIVSTHPSNRIHQHILANSLIIHSTPNGKQPFLKTMPKCYSQAPGVLLSSVHKYQPQKQSYPHASLSK